MMKSLLLTLAAATALLTAPAQSATLAFNLLGTGGVGLLSTNENGAIAGIPGTGGEFGSGITYDDVTNILTVNVAWGSLNGFINLSSDANNSHIHGPTVSGGVASFTQNASVLFNLPRVSSAANGGSIATTVALDAGQEVDLLAGKYYVNIHTGTNGGGEIRGNIVLVPEPSHAILGLVGLALFGARRRR